MDSIKNPVTWFEIYVEDLERAKRFYEALFGVQLTREQTPPDFQAYRFPGGMPGFGAMGGLMKHPMRKPSAQGTLVYFHVDDCALIAERAPALGGCIYRSKWSIGPEGFIALIGDSEGNAIGLHSFD
jgi:uncharacterized protein